MALFGLPGENRTIKKTKTTLRLITEEWFDYYHKYYIPYIIHKYMYAGIMAANVKGIPILKKSEFLTV